MLKRALTVIVPLCAGCYTYQPLRPADAVPGMNVRAHVTSETSARIQPLLGLSGIRDLDGPLISNTDGTLVIEVPTVVQAGVNNAVQTLFQRVTVRPGDLLELESRRLSRTRTAMVVGVAAAGVAIVAASALHKDPGIDAPPPVDGGTEVRVPLVRWFFGHGP